MHKLLQLLKDGNSRTKDQLAAELNTTPADINRQLEYLEYIGAIRKIGRMQKRGCSGCTGCNSGAHGKHGFSCFTKCAGIYLGQGEWNRLDQHNR